MQLNDYFELAQRELHTIRDFVRFGATQFEANKCFFGHGTDNAWDEAACLVMHALFLPPDASSSVFDACLTTHEKSGITQSFEKRITKKLPAAYITREAWFCDMAFYVDERVLVPRSPIAELIEVQFSPWVDCTQVKQIADVGTGSGCIACACASYLEDVSVVGLDIDSDALEVAAMNVADHGLDDQVELIESDCLSAVLERRFDIIVSNPPYVCAEALAALPDEYHAEPRHALAAGQDGLLYIHTLLQQAKQCLNPDGILIVECGDSAAALQTAYPLLDFEWLQFNRGGHGVFMLTCEQLGKI